ncbi:MAG: hypothetical protein JWN86_1955 [Planctomycetota bacterium]|nr:hypothetical protein [Planctomycetota bacterium]
MARLESPYENVKMGVNYVGDAACATCHAEIAASYRKHPMGRSLSSAAALPGHDAGDAPVGQVFQAAGFEYSITSRDGRVYDRETRRDAQGRAVVSVEAVVSYILGSGTRGRSFLSESDGYLVQSPISWYSQEGRWGLAPGFDQMNSHFERPIDPACLSCHSNRVEPAGDAVNRYLPPTFRGESIGCERCHGPGELHVKAPRMLNGIDVTIVNPRRLDLTLRDSVCEQCHLQGDHRIERAGATLRDFRPGLPLGEFLAVYHRTDNRSTTNRAVGHVEQMRDSRCFRETQGTLGCISCHDPHRTPEPAERVAYFRDRCLACHGPNRTGCSIAEPERRARSKDDSCIQCHMPVLKNTDIVHNATTNHRIARNPAVEEPSRNPTGASASQNGAPLELFHPGKTDPDSRRAALRDLGVALVHEGETRRSEAERASFGQMATKLLTTAVKDDPDDQLARGVLGEALLLDDRQTAALAAIQEALVQAPKGELLLDRASLIALNKNRWELAADYTRRVIAVNPRRADYHQRLGHILLQQREWRPSAAASREALRLDPSLDVARMNLITCELKLKEDRLARADLEILQVFDPSKADLLRHLFEPTAK